MNSKLENSLLTVYLNGRIDTTNADKVGAEIEKICGENNFADIVFDAEALEYVSSAGLRMILKFRKLYPTLKMVNVNSDVYDVLEMTGFTEILDVEKAYRKFSVEGCEVIGKGAKGTVYRYNEDTIVKVYKNPDSLPDIKNERELARKAFVLGIPTAISYDVVKVGESFGSVFELLEAKSYSRMIVDDPANRDKYICEFAELLRKIHSTPVSKNDMPDIKKKIFKWVSLDSAYLPAEQVDKLNALVNAVPEVLNMLHCDYHTNNVMLQSGETLLIDMDTLSYGHPIFELANVYITYVGFGEVDNTIVEKFLGMPYDLAKYVWDKFLSDYLGTNNPEKLKKVNEKVQLLSYTRFLNHIVGHKQTDSDYGKQVIALCQQKIGELLGKVDTLEF